MLLSYSWDLDSDGGYCELGEAGLTASRVFPTANMTPGHPVTLRVTDTGEITRTLTRLVVVQATIPNGGIWFAPTAPLPGQAVTFTGSASSPTGKRSPTRMDLNFDPSQAFGTDARGVSVTHSFGSLGPKSIALRVTEVGGGSKSPVSRDGRRECATQRGVARLTRNSVRRRSRDALLHGRRS